MPADDIYVMLGLPLSTGPHDLRTAYERAVSDAARSHNIRRATMLSSAFDRLPEETRGAIYPRRGLARSWDEPPRRRGRISWRLGWIPVVIVVAFVVFVTIRHFESRSTPFGAPQPTSGLHMTVPDLGISTTS